MLKPVKAPYTAHQLLVCTNVRDASTGRASCGAHGGAGLRERLKHAVKARGLKGRVMVTGTSCLGHCPEVGVTVGLYPEGEWRVCEVDEADEAALLVWITDGVGSEPAVGGDR